MSDEVNDSLMYRAEYIKQVYEGTDLELAIDNLIYNNDLEQLDYLITQAESDLAREEFYAADTF